MGAKSIEISERIASLDILAADLGNDFDVAAELAVSGHADAGKKAAEINQRLDRMAVDRRILLRAKARAEAAEARDDAVKAEEERQRHRVLAKGHAARLMEIAGRVDAAVAELAASLPDLQEAERDVRLSLSRAEFRLHGATHGQSGLALLALDRLARLTDGRAKFQQDRSISKVAARAWDFLLNEENVND